MSRAILNQEKKDVTGREKRTETDSHGGRGGTLLTAAVSSEKPRKYCKPLLGNLPVLKGKERDASLRNGGGIGEGGTKEKGHVIKSRKRDMQKKKAGGLGEFRLRLPSGLVGIGRSRAAELNTGESSANLWLVMGERS